MFTEQGDGESGRAGEGDVRQVQAGVLVEQHGGDVAGSGVAVAAHDDAAGLFLGGFDEVVKGLVGAVGTHGVTWKIMTGFRSSV